MSATLRLALADDQALVRAGLRALLESFADLRVVAEAADGDALLAALATTAVDVILSDIRMPGTTGVQAVQRLRAAGDETPVVLLTTFDDADLLLQASHVGAQGFLLKDAAPDELHQVIIAVAAGQSMLQAIATDPVRARYAYPDSDAPKASFSEREIAILRLLAGGYSNKEIARSLFLAEGTVKNYVSDILDKLATRDRTRAVLKAITLRII